MVKGAEELRESCSVFHQSADQVLNSSQLKRVQRISIRSLSHDHWMLQKPLQHIITNHNISMMSMISMHQMSRLMVLTGFGCLIRESSDTRGHEFCCWRCLRVCHAAKWFPCNPFVLHLHLWQGVCIFVHDDASAERLGWSWNTGRCDPTVVSMIRRFQTSLYRWLKELQRILFNRRWRVPGATWLPGERGEGGPVAGMYVSGNSKQKQTQTTSTGHAEKWD